MTSLSLESRNEILRKKKSHLKKKIILSKAKFHKNILGRKDPVQVKKKYPVNYFKQEGFKLSLKSYPLTLSKAV